MAYGRREKVSAVDEARTFYRTMLFCFLAALIEGADIVSMGLAAPKVTAQFGFGPGDMSVILTATVLGLMIGAVAGGRAGDRIGRKRVILYGFVILAIFSIATAHAASLDSFIVIRLLCGVGIGAVFPNLIALASEASPDGKRNTGVGLTLCGTPLGGALLGLAASTNASAADWTWIFYLGGIAPLLLLPLLIVFLPESRHLGTAESVRGREPGKSASSLSHCLFGEGRWLVTTMLWISYAMVQILVYLLNNWLPTLMLSRGFDLNEASLISASENFGAALGCVVLARLADHFRKTLLLAITFAAAAVGLASMAMLTTFWAVLMAGALTGFFVLGGQLILYALAPQIYPARIRSAGTGAAVSFGRLGGIAGPLMAGQLLAAGMSSAGVLLAAIPCALGAGIAAVIVVNAAKDL